MSDGTLAPGDGLVDAVGRAGLVAVLERDPVAALSRLRSQPRAVVLDATVAGAESFVARLRAEGALSGCAVVAIVPQASDAAFSEALAWGVDEVIPASGLRTLTHVVGALKSHDPVQRPPATRGVVLVAAPSPAERLARARPLRNVGFEVVFASDPAELTAQFARAGAAFAVVDAEIFPEGVAGFGDLLRAAPSAPIVAVVPPHEVDALSARLHGEARARVLARHDPPEDAIFLGNELVRPPMTEGRATERLLHATVASFRVEGHEHPTYGITYNVSREGIYVRTLVPPPNDADVWIELRPPTLEGLVHLEARVVWARRFGPSAGATAPAGFGVRITGASERSLARWREGYARLRRSRIGATAEA